MPIKNYLANLTSSNGVIALLPRLLRYSKRLPFDKSSVTIVRDSSTIRPTNFTRFGWFRVLEKNQTGTYVCQSQWDIKRLAKMQDLLLCQIFSWLHSKHILYKHILNLNNISITAAKLQTDNPDTGQKKKFTIHAYLGTFSAF